MKKLKYPFDLYEMVKNIKRKIAEEAIKEFKGNKKRAALAIGVSRANLYSILRGKNETTVKRTYSRT